MLVTFSFSEVIKYHQRTCFDVFRFGAPTVDSTTDNFSGSRLHTIIVAGYVIGATVGFVLVISIVLTAIQRALLLRQIRMSQECRTTNAERGCADDRRRGTQRANDAIGDHPPPYDVAVMDSVVATPSVVGASSDASVPLVPSGRVPGDLVRPPSYTEFLQENSPSKEQ